MREKVTKGWIVVAMLNVTNKKGEKVKKLFQVSPRAYHAQSSAQEFREMYMRSNPGVEAWVEGKTGYETRKGAPEPLIT